jgi:hypothetical protein
MGVRALQQEINTLQVYRQDSAWWGGEVRANFVEDRGLK